jgi:zinc/manganese transport system ATP-binding protein
MPAACISFNGRALGYERQPAVENLSLTLRHGAMVAILGPNGAGKSTLLKGMAGLLRPLSGSVEGLKGHRIAYMPQQAAIDRGFPINVFDFVALGLWHEMGALGAMGRNRAQRCRDALAAVGLDRHGHCTLDALSGGQFQRALFARLMLQDASILLLDEPFASVDERTTDELVAILHRWHAEGRTVLSVLHDVELAKAQFGEALLLAREPIAWGRSSQVLVPQNLELARRAAHAGNAAISWGASDARNGAAP